MIDACMACVSVVRGEHGSMVFTCLIEHNCMDQSHVLRLPIASFLNELTCSLDEGDVAIPVLFDGFQMVLDLQIMLYSFRGCSDFVITKVHVVCVMTFHHGVDPFRCHHRTLSLYALTILVDFFAIPVSKIPRKYFLGGRLYGGNKRDPETFDCWHRPTKSNSNCTKVASG
jgi:hypothetical protein